MKTKESGFTAQEEKNVNEIIDTIISRMKPRQKVDEKRMAAMIDLFMMSKRIRNIKNQK